VKSSNVYLSIFKKMEKRYYSKQNEIYKMKHVCVYNLKHDQTVIIAEGYIKKNKYIFYILG
jgi:hypothetical protein